MLVVGVGVGGGLDDAAEVPRERRDALLGLAPLGLQSGARVVGALVGAQGSVA
ncbi:hypothetical protein [Motilibacter aurantiacus]|uniref:hypothetical protein n=1 Tax=Motilibacter aurantiacus TaxID=2714955 RepID=UPI001E46DFD3|nr:hypothetical protein [Motilibacter aurantiacus]